MSYEDITDWWEFVNQEDFTFSIQWTPKRGGIVRAKLDDFDSWQYKHCGCANNAHSCGISMIESKMKMREHIELSQAHYDDPYYQGA